MNDTDKKDIPISKEEQEVEDAVKCVIACLFMGLVMYWSWTYVGPSGQTSDIGSFLLFWLREVVILGMFAIGLFAWGIIWVVRVLRKKFAGNED